MYTPKKHGQAEYFQHMQIPSSVFDAIVQGTDELNKQDEVFANLVYVVGSSASSTSNDFISADMSVLSATQIAVESNVVSLGTINPLAKTIRISFTGSGDIRLTYDGTNPVGGSLGEIWFKGGFLSVNRTVAASIKLIRDGSTNSSIYVTQFA